MNPWTIKRQIDACFEEAAKYSFELRDDGGYGYPHPRIFLFATPDNEIFSKEMVLSQFDTWSDAQMFLQGYEKCDMAWRIGGKRK